jgi:outer membrane biogenesis lipoprotein LolB
MTCRLAERLLVHIQFSKTLAIITMASSLGCANPDLEQRAALPPAARAPADLSPWMAAGKLAVTADGETNTASFEWRRHDPSRDTITVSGPFSMNRQVMEREGSRLTWQDGGDPRSLSEVTALPPTLRLLAMRNPEIIGQWLLGYSGGAEGWQIDVVTWQTVSPWILPKQLTVVGPELSLKLVVATWEIGKQE